MGVWWPFPGVFSLYTSRRRQAAGLDPAWHGAWRYARRVGLDCDRNGELCIAYRRDERVMIFRG